MWETVWNCVMGVMGLWFLYELLRILYLEFKRRGIVHIAASNFAKSGNHDEEKQHSDGE